MQKDREKYSFLVIEDNPGDFLLIEDYLEEMILSPSITHVTTYAFAWLILHENKGHFDVIFLDLSLPDNHGEKLVQDVVNLSQGSPVIVLTGYTDLRFSLRSLSLGISDYLLKDELTAFTLYKNILYNLERKKSELELKQKNNELKDLSNHLQSIREEERVRIAREIHDELGQQLTALKMDIDWILYKQTNRDEAVISKLTEMTSMSDGIIQTVRRISADLRPPILDDLGLIAAMEWKCNDFENRNDITCSFYSSISERRFNNELSINVYRILQESLTNVSRHAKASSVSVTLGEENGVLTLDVSDDGVGLASIKAEGRQPLGIIGMKERAKLFGGELSVVHGSPSGTTVKLRMPSMDIT